MIEAKTNPEEAKPKEQELTKGAHASITGELVGAETHLDWASCTEDEDVRQIKISVKEHDLYRTTIIENIDQFGIELEELCDAIHRKLGCGASLSPPHADSTNVEFGMTVVVQGNQIEPIGDILINDFDILRKHITSVVHDKFEETPKAISKEKRKTFI